MLKAAKGKVLIKLDDLETERNGLYIPKSAADKPQRGVVVAIAEDTPDYIKEGTIAYLPPIAGVKIPFEGNEYCAVMIHEIYAYEN
jgi:co-chaperonin GroES (HSP10)